jgi:galactonate dehydratase
MRITRLETFLTNAGLRNYLFIRLSTDTGLTGVGEASLEWQEKSVQTLIHEWVEDRILGVNPFDVESAIGGMIRDQYQGGSTVMTAISGVEIALWDIIGKTCGQPVYKLLGGRAQERVRAYANGWYGGARTPEEYAAKAKMVAARGYGGMKFDPFGIAWKTMTPAEMTETETIVAAVREAVGDGVDLMIEGHGRLSVATALEMGRRLTRFRPAWFEEPVTPNCLEQLREVRAALPFPIAAGERLYALEHFAHLAANGCADIVQMDVAHCGGLLAAKKIAALAEAHGLHVSPHVSIGPVALAAALHLDWSTPCFLVQENFAEYDVPWRADLVHGWNPIHPDRPGEFSLPDKPGLGLDIHPEACAAHPYKKNAFPSLWDKRWVKDITQNGK